MKKRTQYSSSRSACIICAVMLAVTSVLASCNNPPDPTIPTTTSYSSPVSYVGNSARKDDEPDIEDYYLTGCSEKNMNYDLTPYKISDEKEVYGAFNVDVSEADLKRYAKDKLDYILKLDGNSARGTFQDYEVEIVRINVFDKWAESCGLDQHGLFNGSMFVGYYKGIADFGALQELQEFDVYKDPSGCFVLVTACGDHKVISEFFENGSSIKGGLASNTTGIDYNEETFRQYFRNQVCTEDQALKWSKDHSTAVFENGVCTSGEGFWGGFYKSFNEGNKAFVMVSKYYTPDEEHAGQELYRPKLIFYFIVFNGEDSFRLQYRNSRGSYDSIKQIDYRYLLRFCGGNEESSEYDYYDVYVLTNKKYLTWEDVQKGFADYPYPSEDFCIVYSEVYAKKTENN